MALTQKQHSFVVAYLKNGFNAELAAKQSGYSERYAKVKSYKLIQNPEIFNRISPIYNAIEAQRFSEICMAISERAEVLDRIIRAVVPKDINEPVKLIHANTAIKAIAELNKMSGDYAPEKRLSVTVDATQKRLLDARKQYDEY